MHFAGPRPVRRSAATLAQADILVSPRTLGENTPMKIYSYLASGRSILATDIGSHTQALDASCALLVRPEPGCVAAGAAAPRRRTRRCASASGAPAPRAPPSAIRARPTAASCRGLRAARARRRAEAGDRVKRELVRLSGEPFDVLVVGGGIHGAAAAREAAAAACPPR